MALGTRSGRLGGWHARPLLVRASLEVGLVLVLFGLYKFGRALVADQVSEAMRHAEVVRTLQASLWLPSEAAIQASVHVESLMRAANVYYTVVHFPLMVAFLVWGFLRRHPGEYRWARNLVVIQTGAALAIHVFFPLAPPRMFPEWGFVDTMERYGPSPYEGVSGDVANQFAAMPSLHVGWAVLIAYVVARTGPRWLAWLAACHAALTAMIVVITANHWWLDGVIGVALLLVAAAVLPRPPAAKHEVAQPGEAAATPDDVAA